MTKPVHKHFILRSEVKDPPRNTDQLLIKNWTSSQACKDFEAKLSFNYPSSLPKLDPNDEIPPITVGDTKGFPITHVYLDGTPFDGSKLQKK